MKNRRDFEPLDSGMLEQECYENIIKKHQIEYTTRTHNRERINSYVICIRYVLRIVYV